MKRQVLHSFKSLHKTGKIVFEGDSMALNKLKQKVNEEFKKNKNIDDTKRVDELVKLANEVERELRTSVIQAVEVQPGKYEAKIRAEVNKLDNVPFKDMCNNTIGKT